MPSRAAEAQRRILETEDLPPLPHVATELLTVIQGGNDAEQERLRDIVEQDPGLTARVMGWANSAYFGTRGNVRDLDRAIFGIIGLRTVSSLVLSIVLSRVFDTRACPAFDLTQYWHRALLTAHCGREGARLKGTSLSPEDAFLSGLLHNLGLLLLVHLFPEEMDALFQERGRMDDAELRAAETEKLGLDHVRAGAMLSHRWHLPEEVVTVISHYPDKPAPRGMPLAALVGICRKQVDRILEGDPGAPEQTAVRPPSWLHIPPADWRELMADLMTKKESLRTQAETLS